MFTHILIVTNGSKESFAAVEQGNQLAAHLELPVTLLGITERLDPAAIDAAHPLEAVFEKAVRLFEARGAAYRLEVRNGSAEKILPVEAQQGDPIVVVGSMGRPQIQRMVSGRSIRHFIADVQQPILYVPEMRIPIRRIVISVGGLGYDVNAGHLALQLAETCKAEVTFLHIVPPIELNYPTATAVNRNWQNVIESDTPIGRNLKQSLEHAKSLGVNAAIKVRHGNVIEEIQAELLEGRYDLLCMGSSYSVHSLRQMYSANVTAEIMERVRIPVLTARFRLENAGEEKHER